ncbi:MAG TPA: hypothetical protein VGL09_11290 [Methylomirabilota bacterium]|jgi:hypothetical protein
MSTLTLAAAPRPGTVPFFTTGRSFVHPVFDYAIIGGGLSLIVGAMLYAQGVTLGLGTTALAWCILLSNGAHFAASTVRLYTRPGAVKNLPFLTLGLPVVGVAIVTAAIAVREPFGLFLFALYLLWSPYHYSAQAYGLSVMYAYRSGVGLGDGEKRLVWWTCLVPFAWTLLQPESGLGKLVIYAGVRATPPLDALRWGASATLTVLTLVTPVLLFLWLRARHGVVMPMVSVLVIGSNAVWWTLFTFLDAFVYVTVFHGLQYLAIATIFHVKDRTRATGARHGAAFHTVAFYVPCVVLGYILFNVWPDAYRWAGLNVGKSVLLVTAAVNIHHFIVDAYIWRLRRDPNYRNVVDIETPVPA